MKTKQKTLRQTLTDYLETQVNFRDYTIHSKKSFGKINKVAVHQQVDKDSLEGDVENALYNFSRDGFGNVVFYI